MYGERWEKRANVHIFLAQRAESYLNIVRRTNAEQKYHEWRQLTHFHCTTVRRRPPSLFRQSRVLRFPC